LLAQPILTDVYRSEKKMTKCSVCGSTRLSKRKSPFFESSRPVKRTKAFLQRNFSKTRLLRITRLACPLFLHAHAPPPRYFSVMSSQGQQPKKRPAAGSGSDDDDDEVIIRPSAPTKKAKADAGVKVAEGSLAARGRMSGRVDADRIRTSDGASVVFKKGASTVIYWMSRDQRVEDNWALTHAQDVAKANKAQLVVAFCLSPNFPGAVWRHYWFMLEGLKEVEQACRCVRFLLLMCCGSADSARLGSFFVWFGLVYNVCFFV
jgi:hypothetical protein